jgi:cGMP-dependent protein kinase
MMKKEKFKKGEIIFSEGEMGEKLYLIKKGKVKVFKKSKFIRELCEGNCFGEVSLLINELRSATIISESDLSLFSLTKNDFNSIIDKRMLEYLSKKISLQDNFNLTLNDLFFCKNLGKGKFGKVSLVHNLKNFFAIKAVNRKSAEKQKILIKYFLQERNILLKLEHPFIMKLVKTLKTEYFIFFLLEYIPGRCLSKYLSFRQQKQLKNIKETQFYIGTLLLIIDYLNSMRICHRDLKPDNIIINENGYLKLIDFGTSIQLKDFTNTITGTPHYISPEVLSGKGYGFSCDYWSIGIIAYEIYFGFYPFGRNAKDPIDVYREVIRKELIIKNCDNDILQLIYGLLKKKVNLRICSLDKAKKLNLFKNFNWDDLIQFNIIPPYIPKIPLLNQFKDYTIQYLLYVKKELEEKIKNDDSLLSSYYDDDKNIDYDSNWADNF